MFIAHSTTQATNALLEGDVARVGIVGAGRRGERWKARLDTRVPPVPLAPGKALHAAHAFAPIDDPDRAADAARTPSTRCRPPASRSSSPARRSPWTTRRSRTRSSRSPEPRGLWATSGHEVSALYGLRTRTRTAVLNARDPAADGRHGDDDRVVGGAGRHPRAADDHAVGRRRDDRGRGGAAADPDDAVGPGGRHRRRADARAGVRRHLHRGRRHQRRHLGHP